ncbi:MAG: AAA family ATPase [Bacilli bacterium]|nr:AAA family ATPase [Bacilli bacterium]
MRDYDSGNKLYELRKKHNLTQEELAYKLKISDKAISKWENGSSKPSISNLKKLSEIYDMSIDKILLKDKEPKKTQIIKKIVITGGSDAGKTTAMNWIQNNFEKKGYKVIFIDSAAKEFINDGVLKGELKSTLKYQSIVIDMQIAKEKIYEEAAKQLPFEKILLVCKRGTVDAKAYMSKRDFEYMLKERNLNEVELRDAYDAVFHLVTSASGAEEYFLIDDPLRDNLIEEAKRIDDQIINAWTGHKYFRVIDNRSTFQNKMKQLIKEISLFLGEEGPYETQRKFLIKKPDIETLNKLHNCNKVKVIEIYLNEENNNISKLIQRGINSNYTYSKITKNKDKNVETEIRLSQDAYIEELINIDTSKKIIIKDRYCLTENSIYYEIDIYEHLEDKAICEVELTRNNEFKLPSIIEVIEDITNNEEYTSYYFASIK